MPDDFPNRLRKLRESQRPVKKMKVVSELCGLSSDSVRKYERGERKPNFDALIALADYYGVSIDYLVGHDGGGDNVTEEPKNNFQIHQK